MKVEAMDGDIDSTVHTQYLVEPVEQDIDTLHVQTIQLLSQWVHLCAADVSLIVYQVQAVCAAFVTKNQLNQQFVLITVVDWV